MLHAKKYILLVSSVRVTCALRARALAKEKAEPPPPEGSWSPEGRAHEAPPHGELSINLVKLALVLVLELPIEFPRVTCTQHLNTDTHTNTHLTRKIIVSQHATSNQSALRFVVLLPSKWQLEALS